jgi:hypothetical protein
MTFEPGTVVELIEEIRSYGKGLRLYGNKGEKVKIKSTTHYPVLIVEGKKEIFPVHINRVR